MTSTNPVWTRIAIITGRVIFAGVFAMSTTMKFTDIGGTAGYIASVGFPAAGLLAWLAALFELGLFVALLSGAYFREAALAAAAYVLFLGLTFHGPAHWAGNPMEFGFFVDHFTFIAGLLFAAVHGPGDILVLKLSLLGRNHPLASRA